MQNSVAQLISLLTVAYVPPLSLGSPGLRRPGSRLDSIIVAALATCLVHRIHLLTETSALNSFGRLRTACLYNQHVHFYGGEKVVDELGTEWMGVESVDELAGARDKPLAMGNS